MRNAPRRADDTALRTRYRAARGDGPEDGLRRITISFVLLIALSACGGNSATSSTTSQPPGTTDPTTTTTPGVVSGLDLVAGLRARTNDTTTTVGGSPITTIPTDDPGPFDPGPSYTEYMTITDDSGLIELSVPVEWGDFEGHGWTSEGEYLGPGLVAAPDVDAWRAEWGTPGVFIGASDLFDETTSSALDAKRWDAFCAYDGRDEYDDGLYTGHYDLYYDCGDELSVFIVIAAEPPDGAFLIIVQIVVVTGADLEAADEIIRTFQVHGVEG